MTMSSENIENSDVIDLAEREAVSQVVAYALGQLGPRERAEFEQRMAEDPALARQVEEEQAFADSLRTALPAGMPRAEAFAALELSEAPRQRKYRYGYAAAAAAAAVFGLGLLLSVSTPEPGYEALSSDAPVVVSQGVVYRVVLKSEGVEGARDWLAADYQLEIVSGTDAVLVLSRATPLSTDELQTLRQHPAIALLEQRVE